MNSSPVPDLLCIGAVLWDFLGYSPATMKRGQDLPGSIVRRPGGVAMNAAMTLSRLGLRPALLAAVGADPDGEELLAECIRLGIHTEFLQRIEGTSTDRYIAIEDEKGLVAAIANVRLLEEAAQAILQPLSDGRLGSLETPWAGLVVMDGNLPEKLLEEIALSPLFAAADLRVAPASPGKAERIRPLLRHPNLTLYLNLEEAGLLCQRKFAKGAMAGRALLEQGAARVLVTNGAGACVDATTASVLTGTPPTVVVQRVTGAGDTFMAAHIAAEKKGAGRAKALSEALQAAADHVAGLGI